MKITDEDNDDLEEKFFVGCFVQQNSESLTDITLIGTNGFVSRKAIKQKIGKL